VEEYDARMKGEALTLVLALTFAMLIAVGVMLYEIKRRTKALNESEAGLRRAQTLAGLSHVVSDAGGTFERWSETFPKIIQREEQGMPRDTRAWLAYVHPDDRGRFRAKALEARASNSRTMVEYRLVRDDGSHAHIVQVMEPMGDHWFSTLQDVTEQAKLRSESSAKSTFLSTMSHEIRTPMNGVLGMLELLSLTHLDEQQAATLDIVRDSGRSLLRIIDDILDFSKIEAGKLEIRPEPASVAKVIDNVAGIYAGNASKKALLLKSSSDPRISPAVVVDRVRLQQVLNNLMSNAIKFTSKGFVEIRAELVERRGDVDVVRFVVKDTGIGIAPEAQAKLFQPFEQAGGDIARAFGGTGLGLSIADRLTRMMGGSIEISSQPGIGTEVSVMLPLPVADPASLPGVTPSERAALAEEIQARRIAPSTEEATREGTLILVVDDHPVNRMVLERQVRILGYADESAESGRQALELWKSGRFGAVVTDCNMPDMDGYDLARAIRAVEKEKGLARTPIIACTASALQGEADNCLAAGMDDYITKPVDLKTLGVKLDRWLPDRHGP
jgi:signal transduction histidine kinase/ActR/RegA family two-component response regulator